MYIKEVFSNISLRNPFGYTLSLTYTAGGVGIEGSLVGELAAVLGATLVGVEVHGNA